MTEDFSSWIGKTVSRDDLVTPRLLDQFRATLGPHLFDCKDEAPPGFHWCLAVPAHGEENLGADGAETKGLFIPPVSPQRRMWAGGRIESLAPIRPGDRIGRMSSVSDVKSKAGASGRLCIVSVTHEITASGTLAVRERQDLLFRDASAAPAKPESPPEPPADTTWKVDASPLLLFRFSALTFNGHRIHYDTDYAREQEGYGGLLVHGPLQAALMLNLASVLLGRVPPAFDYRCIAPLLAGQAIAVTGRKTGEAAATAVHDAAGTMTSAGVAG